MKSLMLFLFVAQFSYSYAQNCNVQMLNKVVIKVITLDKQTVSVTLDSCGMTSPKVPQFTKELYVSSPEISELIPHSITNLPNLEMAYLNAIKIKRIHPKAFQNLTNINYLYLQNNELQRIEGGAFNDLKSLKSINLARNDISAIDNDAFKGMTELSSVDLDANELVEWKPEWFNNGPRLWSLSLSGNKIKHFPKGAFANHDRLNSLDLSHNQMTSIDPALFKGVNNLHSLRLDNNQIEEFHKGTFSYFNGTLFEPRTDKRKGPITSMDRHMFATFSGIRTLYINNNRLTYLPEKMLKDLHKTSQINFHSNPWQCACHEKILKWLNERGASRRADIFKNSCVKASNPICATSSTNPGKCVEQVDKGVQKTYYENYVRPEDASYLSRDIDCF